MVIQYFRVIFNDFRGDFGKPALYFTFNKRDTELQNYLITGFQAKERTGICPVTKNCRFALLCGILLWTPRDNNLIYKFTIFVFCCAVLRYVKVQYGALDDLILNRSKGGRLFYAFNSFLGIKIGAKLMQLLYPIPVICLHLFVFLR